MTRAWYCLQNICLYESTIFCIIIHDRHISVHGLTGTRSWTLPCRRSLSYRNLSIDLQNKSMDSLLYDRDLCHERINVLINIEQERFFNFLVLHYVPHPILKSFVLINTINYEKLINIPQILTEMHLCRCAWVYIHQDLSA